MNYVAIFMGIFIALLAERKATGKSDWPSPGAFLSTLDEAVKQTAEKIGGAAETAASVAVGAARSIFGTPYDDLIDASAKRYGLDPALLYRLLYQESRFRPDIISGKVKSPVGALGIAQFMPATAAQELGSVDAALDPNQAIPGAARYLSRLISITGSVSRGVAAYNWGVGNVQRKGVASAPAETQNYVKAITGENLA